MAPKVPQITPSTLNILRSPWPAAKRRFAVGLPMPSERRA
jgi:hypothetical protein